jgi:hypothetical protein
LDVLARYSDPCLAGIRCHTKLAGRLVVSQGRGIGLDSFVTNLHLGASNAGIILDTSSGWAGTNAASSPAYIDLPWSSSSFSAPGDPSTVITASPSPSFHWFPFVACNFLVLGGATTLPLLLANLVLAQCRQDRTILALRFMLCSTGLCIVLALLDTPTAGVAGFPLYWSSRRFGSIRRARSDGVHK